MKRFGNLFDKIIDMNNLREAHKHAKLGKRHYKEVQAIEPNIEHNLLNIREMLKQDMYYVSAYSYRKLVDKGKVRELYKLPYYPDRIIQWAIMLQIGDILESTFCSHSCASIKNRGIHYATKYVDTYMEDRYNTKYCLKLDINKFYASINHVILKKLLSNKFKDKKLLNLLGKIIDSFPDTKGIPIGSYLSQFLANYYLTYFDHYLKNELRIKYVVRYMDDIVIFSNNKQELHYYIICIKNYLLNILSLTVKDNWQVFPTNIRGVDFVGYRHFHNYKLLRKRSALNFKRACRCALKHQQRYGKVSLKNKETLMSYLGWLKWCNSFRLRKKYLKELNL